MPHGHISSQENNTNRTAKTQTRTRAALEILSERLQEPRATLPLPLAPGDQPGVGAPLRLPSGNRSTTLGACRVDVGLVWVDGLMIASWPCYSVTSVIMYIYGKM